MIKLGIRVANSITAGRGHFERCFAISNHISEKIFWFLDEKSYFFESRIKNNDEIIYEKNITQISHMIKTVNELTLRGGKWSKSFVVSSENRF